MYSFHFLRYTTNINDGNCVTQIHGYSVRYDYYSEVRWSGEIKSRQNKLTSRC